MSFLWLTKLSLPGVLDRVPEDLRGPADALLIRVGVHPKGNRFVAVSQSLGHAGDVCAAGDGHAGEGVPLWHNKDKSENHCIATG